MYRSLSLGVGLESYVYVGVFPLLQLEQQGKGSGDDVLRGIKAKVESSPDICWLG